MPAARKSKAVGAKFEWPDVQIVVGKTSVPVKSITSAVKWAVDQIYMPEKPRKPKLKPVRSARHGAVRRSKVKVKR